MRNFLAFHNHKFSNELKLSCAFGAWWQLQKKTKSYGRFLNKSTQNLLEKSTQYTSVVIQNSRFRDYLGA